LLIRLIKSLLSDPLFCRSVFHCLSVLVAAVVAVASSAAFFDSQTVSFRFASGQIPLLLLLPLRFLLLPHFILTAFKSIAVLLLLLFRYSSLLAVCGLHFACLFPGHDDQIDFGRCCCC
jgi:hypothetical protein